MDKQSCISGSDVPLNLLVYLLNFGGDVDVTCQLEVSSCKALYQTSYTTTELLF
jgi:hypothetical protein